MNYESMQTSNRDQGNSSDSSQNDSRTTNSRSGKIENIAFYIFILTAILSPLAFWWSSFVSQDMIKTLVISIGVITSAILLAFVVIKEKKVALPPRTLTCTSMMLLVSIVISSFLSLNIGKSFFGQVFEIGNASFIALLFLAGLVAYSLVIKQKDRAVVVYVGLVSAYLVLFILHFLRIVFGNDFMNLGVLNNLTSSIFGAWYGLATFSALIFIISILAIMFLQLSGRMKIVFWSLVGISTLGILLIADIRVWYVMTIVFFGFSFLTALEKWKLSKNSASGIISRIWRSVPLLPVIILLILVVTIYRGPQVLGSIIQKMNIVHSEVYLPWQTTLQVTASTIQNYPLFGVGSNGFSQAYLAYKPLVINSTNAWGTEFTYGVGLVPTFIASHGVVGSILWVLLFVFFGIIATKVLKNLPSDSEKRFMLVSSFMSSVFLWILSFITVPSHTIIFFGFILTAIFISLATSYGIISERVYAPRAGSVLSKVFASFVALVILILVVWGLVYIKKVMAFSYFSRGFAYISTTKDLAKADAAFNKAINLDESDVYWRAKAEVAILTADKLASTITSTSSASTTQAVLTDINTVLNKGLADAKKATAYDSNNYYNYLSEARVAEYAASVKMPNGYESALTAYRSAINLNPYNPSLYFDLANFQAKNTKYDEALQELGRALQVKNNYLDAVYLLSQIYAAKGDLANAITAASVAVQLNPQNSVLQFQLGLLKYNAKDYAGAILAMTEAVKVQPDYANAKYFLGLSEARLNNNGKAIAQFEDLIKTNPDNQEIALILSNLRSGRSIFADAQPPVTTAPEKRATLPVKEKR